MVGLGIGLVVSSGALALFLHQLEASRHLLLETRLSQELHAVADLIARDLRRAGYWQGSIEGVLPPARLNPYRETAPTVSQGASPVLSYFFSRDAKENNAVDDNERLGFRLRDQVLQAQVGRGNWQSLTDPLAVRINAFSVTPRIETLSLGQYCTPACTLAQPACPYMRVRRYDILITGQAASDAKLVRQVRESVRLRNDEMPIMRCPS